MRIAILLQSFGRFGGAERLALSHYAQLRRMGYDVALFYKGTMSEGWRRRLENEPILPIPSGFTTSLEGLRRLSRFLATLRQFDRIIIHHHVEPLLAFHISKRFGSRVIWYSGSVFELPWEEYITGIDYRLISPTVRKTGIEFYGPMVTRALLSNQLYGLTARCSRMFDLATVRSFGKVIANNWRISLASSNSCNKAVSSALGFE